MGPVSGIRPSRSVTIPTTVWNRSHPDTSDALDQAAKDCHRVTRQSRTDTPLAALDEDLSMDDRSDMSTSGDEDDSEIDHLHRSSRRTTIFGTRAHSVDEPSTPSSNLRSSNDTEAGQCYKRQCMQLRNQHGGLEAHVRATDKRIAKLTDKNRRLRGALQESEASRQQGSSNCNITANSSPQYLEANDDAALPDPSNRSHRHTGGNWRVDSITNQYAHYAITFPRGRKDRKRLCKALREEAQKVIRLTDELGRLSREFQALKASMPDSQPVSPTNHDEIKTTRDIGVQCLRNQNAAVEIGGGGKHQKCTGEEEEMLRIENLQLRDEVRRLSVHYVRTRYDSDDGGMIVGTSLW